MIHPKSRKQQIVDAARKLIFKYGCEHLTVRRIAKEVGISEAAIYRHFPSKRSIMSLMADHIAANLLGDISRASGSAISRLESLDLTMRNHFSAIEQRRGLAFRVIAEIVTQNDKLLNKKVADVIDNYIRCLEELLAEGVRSGEVRQDLDLHAAAQLLFSMIQGLATIWTLHNHSFDLVKKYAEQWKLYKYSIAMQRTGNCNP